MKILQKKSYSYILFEDDGRTYLYVLCGTVGLFELIVELDEDEVAMLGPDRKQLEEFVKKITSSPDKYRARQVKREFNFPNN